MEEPWSRGTARTKASRRCVEFGGSQGAIRSAAGKVEVVCIERR